MRTSIVFLVIMLLAGCTDDHLGPAGPDNSNNDRPHVAITTPQEGCVFEEGIYPIRVTAFHTSGISYVRLKIGLKDFRLDYTEPYEYVWIVGEGADPEVSEGEYQINALAVDNNGNSNSHTIRVSVDY